MIRSLAGVTIVTPDLDAAVAAYQMCFNYHGAPPMPVGRDLARAWGVPQAAGARMAVLYPTDSKDRFIRLVEGIPAPGFATLESFGWVAAEIVVQNVDALADQLADSAFRIIGPPAVLEFEFTDQIRAMQAIGPGGEVLYLTQIDGTIPGFTLPVAHSFVSQPFIVVLASADIARASAFYANLGREVSPVMTAPIQILSDVHGLPPGYRHSLATVALDSASLIEIDAFPTVTKPRPLSSVGLPCGVAMVSFYGDIPAMQANGTIVVKGACDEWIEVIACAAP